MQQQNLNNFSIFVNTTQHRRNQVKSRISQNIDKQPRQSSGSSPCSSKRLPQLSLSCCRYRENCFWAALSSWPQLSYLNSKVFGLWDFHLAENGRACLHSYVRKLLPTNYNFLHRRTRRWHVDRTALFVGRAATWREILVVPHCFRVFTVSADNEVIWLWERWYCIERLCSQRIPPWNGHVGHDLTSSREPVGRKQECYKSQ